MFLRQSEMKNLEVKAKAGNSLAVKDQRAQRTKVETTFRRSPITWYLLKYVYFA